MTTVAEFMYKFKQALTFTEGFRSLDPAEPIQTIRLSEDEECSVFPDGKTIIYSPFLEPVVGQRGNPEFTRTD